MYEEWDTVQKIIIGYIFKNGAAAFHKTLGRIKSQYFQANYKVLWGTFKVFYLETGGIPSLTALRSFWREKKVDEDKIFGLERALHVTEEYTKDIKETDYIYYVGKLESVYREVKFAELHDKAYVVFQERGFLAAREFLLTSFSELEGGYMDVAPDGLIEDEVDTFIAEVGSARDIRVATSVNLGIETLDNEILGLRGGDVCLLVGWTSVGKTSLAVHVAIDAVYSQGKNVVFVTTETVRGQTRRRLMSRLTRQAGFPAVVTSKTLKEGNLSDEEQAALLHAKEYVSQPGHGHLMVTQAPVLATMSWLRGKLLQYESSFRVDLLILDDIRNMVPYPRRKAEHEEMAQLMRDLKRIARTHGGRGIPVLSPYHVGRDAYKAAKDKGGHYDLSALASTSEAERQTDIVITAWRDEDVEEMLRLDILKLRDGRAGASVRLSVDFGTQYFWDAPQQMLV